MADDMMDISFANLTQLGRCKDSDELQAEELFYSLAQPEADCQGRLPSEEGHIYAQSMYAACLTVKPGFVVRVSASISTR